MQRPAASRRTWSSVGVLDVELRQPRREDEERARRQRGRHARQAQRVGAGGVTQHHVAHFEGGNPAGRTDADVADAHRNPYRTAGMPLYRRAPILDVRQNPPLQSQPGKHQQTQQREAEPHGRLPCQLKRAPPRHEAQPPDDWIEKCAQLRCHEKFGTGWQRPRPQCRRARQASLRARRSRCRRQFPGTFRNTPSSPVDALDVYESARRPFRPSASDAAPLTCGAALAANTAATCSGCDGATATCSPACPPGLPELRDRSRRWSPALEGDGTPVTSARCASHASSCWSGSRCSTSSSAPTRPTSRWP